MARIQFRRGIGSLWTSVNPILAAGEFGVETDAIPVRMKVGNGVTAWNSLPYVTSPANSVDETLLRTRVANKLDGYRGLLNRWAAGLEVAWNSQVNVLVPADSMTLPWGGVGGGVYSWLELTVDYFRGLGYACTADWMPAGRNLPDGTHPGHTTTGSAGTLGLGCQSVSLDPGEYYEFTFGGETNNPADAAALYVTMNAAGSSTATVTLDGTPVLTDVTTVDSTPGAILGHHKLYETPLQDGKLHTVRITAGGTGVTKVDGYLKHHGTLMKGIILWNAGLNGSSFAIHYGYGGFQDALRKMADDLYLVILPSGLITYSATAGGTATSGQDYVTGNQTAMTYIRANSDSDILLVKQYEAAGFGDDPAPEGTGWDGFNEVVGPLAGPLAELNEAGYVDLGPALGTRGGHTDTLKGIDVWTWLSPIDGNDRDHLHTNHVGQRLIADTIWPVLSLGRTAPRTLPVPSRIGAGGKTLRAFTTDDGAKVMFEAGSGFTAGFLFQHLARATKDYGLTTSPWGFTIRDEDTGASKIEVVADADNVMRVRGDSGGGGAEIRVATDGAHNDSLIRRQWAEGRYGRIVERTTFTANGTFTKPAYGTMVRILLFGGGGGGGSGRKGAAGSVRCGGGGGAGGSSVEIWLPLSALDATCAVTVGASGAGGGSVSASDTNGNVGTAGGNTTVVASASLTLVAVGGQPGAGGTNATGLGGTNTTAINGLNGGSASVTGDVGAGGAAKAINSFVAGGGGSGGGITTANAASAGARGSNDVDRNDIFGPTGAGVSLADNPGGGGGGGAGSTSGAATAGSAGGARGGGGGGGGAAVNAVGNSGAGGAGGLGEVIFEVY